MIGDDPWFWRRSMAFTGCAFFLVSSAYAILLVPTDRMTAILSFCVPAFGATFAAYAGLAVADDHMKRETARKVEATQQTGTPQA